VAYILDIAYIHTNPSVFVDTVTVVRYVEQFFSSLIYIDAVSASYVWIENDYWNSMIM